jgi:hypothetical protein
MIGIHKVHIQTFNIIKTSKEGQYMCKYKVQYPNVQHHKDVKRRTIHILPNYWLGQSWLFVIGPVVRRKMCLLSA